MPKGSLWRRGLKRLLKGDFRSIFRWGRERIEEVLATGMALETSSYPAPSWAIDAGNVPVLTWVDDELESRHIPVLERSTERSCSVSPDRPFTAIETDVVLHERIDTFEVRTVFKTVDGGEVVRSFEGTLDDSFELDEPLPLTLTSNVPANSAHVSLTTSGTPSTTGPKIRILNAISNHNYRPTHEPRLGLPRPRHQSGSCPVFLISIDALRHDCKSELEPLIDALGPNTVYPIEPRTQGHWTAPSHASMLTGVHPGEHRYVGWGHGANTPIHWDLKTAPQILSENGYKCSALVSNTNIPAELGFGRGFHRYHMDPMNNWLTRDRDAQEKVDKLLGWVAEDTRISNEVFYFLHVFDPHLPYLPPLPNVEADEFDLKGVAEYKSAVTSVGLGPDYMAYFNGEVDIERPLVEKIRSYYLESVRYTASQVARLIDGLKHQGVFDESLVIITGDHGEEFGDRNFWTHNSLYDANIRPFMAVKPPADADWSVPDDPDLIDILPTIAEAIGDEQPIQCQGRPWQKSDDRDGPRFTERIRPDYYNVAVEEEGLKGIFSYRTNWPDRPSTEVIGKGLVHQEFYRLEDVRSGTFDDCSESLSSAERQRMRKSAESFVLADPIVDRIKREQQHLHPSKKAEELLEHLGYT